MRAAAGAIGEVLAGQRLPEALQRHMAALPPASRAPARDMAYQALRNKARVTALTSLLNGRAPDRMVLALQWVALAQLLEPMRAQAIVVDQAVAAARATFPAAAGFLNATLRRFLRLQRLHVRARFGCPGEGDGGVGGTVGDRHTGQRIAQRERGIERQTNGALEFQQPTVALIARADDLRAYIGQLRLGARDIERDARAGLELIARNAQQIRRQRRVGAA
jgi:hypothetical protein